MELTRRPIALDDLPDQQLAVTLKWLAWLRRSPALRVANFPIRDGSRRTFATRDSRGSRASTSSKASGAGASRRCEGATRDDPLRRGESD